MRNNVFTYCLGLLYFILFVNARGGGKLVKWGIALFVVVACVIALLQMRNKEEKVLMAALFTLPFGLGFVFDPVMKVDLIFATDSILFLLWAMWIHRTNFFSRGGLIVGKFGYGGIVMIAWSAITLIVAISQKATGFGIYMTIKSFMFYLYLINNVTTRRKLELVLFWLSVGLAFQGVLGVSQYVTRSTLGLDFLGSSAKAWSSQIFRVRGTLGYPNQYGAFLIFLIPVAFSMYAFMKKSTKKYFYGLASLFGLLSLFFSFSRSAWAGLLVATALFVWILFQKKLFSAKFLAAISLALVAISAVVYVNWDLIVIRFETGAAGEHRMTMIDIAFDLIKEHWFIGVGLNNYQWHSYPIFRFWHPVHNTYLRLAAETGIPGLLMFLFLVFTTLSNAYRGLRYRDRLLFATSLGVFGGMCAFLVSIHFGPEYQHYRIKLLFWIFAALAFIVHRIRARDILLKKQQQRSQSLDEPAPHKSPPTPPYQPTLPGSRTR